MSRHTCTGNMISDLWCGQCDASPNALDLGSRLFVSLSLRLSRGVEPRPNEKTTRPLSCWWPRTYRKLRVRRDEHVPSLKFDSQRILTLWGWCFVSREIISKIIAFQPTHLEISVTSCDKWDESNTKLSPLKYVTVGNSISSWGEQSRVCLSAFLKITYKISWMDDAIKQSVVGQSSCHTCHTVANVAIKRFASQEKCCYSVRPRKASLLCRSQ